jgi:dGTPase
MKFKVDNRWDNLLTSLRFRPKSASSTVDGRDEFENDYSRLITSAPIRRLQDKTQVFPLEKSDFVRTRLTHSLEVSSIARSLGKSLEVRLQKIGLLSKYHSGELSSLLATAGLIHDLGNPPFGHFGEVAIQAFFKEYLKKNGRGLNRQETADFTNFDGNVQTFRILRKLYFFGDEFGYNLSFPTLSSIIKYPNSSIVGNVPKDKRKHIKDKKFGYFVSEESDFLEIWKRLKLKNQRHPITYLLEAADDIAFLAADIEDAAKLKIISSEHVEWAFNSVSAKFLLEGFKDDYSRFKALAVDELDIAIQRLRVKVQGYIIESVIEEFITHYEAIMNGKYSVELITQGKGGEIKIAIDNLMGLILKSRKVINVELAGWEVIHGLLNQYIPACLSTDFKKGSKTKEGRLYQTISSSYRHIFENHSKHPNDKYNRIQLVTDFISGMTDTYALELYQTLAGIRII